MGCHPSRRTHGLRRSHGQRTVVAVLALLASPQGSPFLWGTVTGRSLHDTVPQNNIARVSQIHSLEGQFGRPPQDETRDTSLCRYSHSDQPSTSPCHAARDLLQIDVFAGQSRFSRGLLLLQPNQASATVRLHTRGRCPHTPASACAALDRRTRSAPRKLRCSHCRGQGRMRSAGHAGQGSEKRQRGGDRLGAEVNSLPPCTAAGPAGVSVWGLRSRRGHRGARQVIEG